MRSGNRLSHGVLALAVTCVWLFGAPQASATTITYDEAVGGELAGQSIGTFDIGANTVTGSEAFSPSVTFDSFLFTVADGQQLDSIELTSFTGAAQGFTLAPPGPLSTTTRYGFLLVGSGDVGSDILPALLLSDAGKTATAPLPSGIYQVALGSSGATTYQYTFNVSAAEPTPVPEPAPVALLGMSLVGFVFRRALAPRARREA